MNVSIVKLANWIIKYMGQVFYRITGESTIGPNNPHINPYEYSYKLKHPVPDRVTSECPDVKNSK